MHLCRALALLVLILGGCSSAETPSSSEASNPSAAVAPVAVVKGEAVAEITRADVPLSMRSCWTCHRPIVESYLGHGMAGSLGPVSQTPVGSVSNPTSGNRYDFDKAGWLDASLGNGGRRRQKVIGQIGAGIFDISWVTEEIDLNTGAATGRLFFAPAETVTGLGLALSPFENHVGSQGLDLALTYDCLTCHTRSDLSALPNAGTGPSGEVYPRNLLGADAFQGLEALDCSACHGEASQHLEIVAGTTDGGGEIGISRLGDLPTQSQLDICARCHLQGEARLELVSEIDGDRALGSQWPTLVPAQGVDGFRFVSQLERLGLSPCFKGSSEMTCTTCHEPHVSVAQQGLESLEAVCMKCHQQECSRDSGLRVSQVTGQPARSEAGCVDCHVRRSQPFDLPHIRNADHWIRRRIPKPTEVPHRQFADARGGLEVFDAGGLAAGFETEGGRRWKSGVEALGWMTLGRFEAARSGFEAFPAPGTRGAVTPTAPQGWASLETSGIFHELRAVFLQAQGDLPAAVAAYSDALAVDPGRVGARLGRARLSLAGGDLLTVVQDTQVIIDEHPRAEAPWDLRAQMALRVGRPDMAIVALNRSASLWPSNPQVWLQLARALGSQGKAVEAQKALDRARLLNPELAAAHAAATTGSPGG